MSQQATARREAGRGGGRKPGYYPRGGGVDLASKAYKSTISKIALHTFNTGQNKYAAQFTQWRDKVANYLQQTSTDEGYLVAKTIQTGKEQSIPLPPPVDAIAPDKADLDIIQEEDIEKVCQEATEAKQGPEEGVHHSLRTVLPGSPRQVEVDKELGSDAEGAVAARANLKS